MKLNNILYLTAVKVFYSTYSYLELPNVRRFREYAALRVDYWYVVLLVDY